MSRPLHLLSDSELLDQTSALAAAEREAARHVLQHLKELKARQLHLKPGEIASDVFEWAEELEACERSDYCRNGSKQRFHKHARQRVTKTNEMQRPGSSLHQSDTTQRFDKRWKRSAWVCGELAR